MTLAEMKQVMKKRLQAAHNPAIEAAAMHERAVKQRQRGGNLTGSGQVGADVRGTVRGLQSKAVSPGAQGGQNLRAPVAPPADTPPPGLIGADGKVDPAVFQAAVEAQRAPDRQALMGGNEAADRLGGQRGESNINRSGNAHDGQRYRTVLKDGELHHVYDDGTDTHYKISPAEYRARQGLAQEGGDPDLSSLAERVAAQRVAGPDFEEQRRDHPQAKPANPLAPANLEATRRDHPNPAARRRRRGGITRGV